MKIKNSAPENKAREVVEACADCDCCRPPMDPPCAVFEALYRLWDQEKETGESIRANALRRIVDLCNFCALCPCPNIRADIIEAKTLFVARDGLTPGVALIEDVERLAHACGIFPRIVNRLLKNGPVGTMIKKGTGIQRQRQLPAFPAESFDNWAKGRGLGELPGIRAKRKVAYFAGCTGRFLFPEVPKTAVALLEQLGVVVHFPEQRCCGMPPLLEGDRPLALKFVRENINRMAELVADGFEIVCSCPTCAFLLRTVIPDRGVYSSEYQEWAGGDKDHILVPVDARDETKGHIKLSRTIYRNVLKDDGIFVSIDPLARIRVAQQTWDIGEYLFGLHRAGRLAFSDGGQNDRLVYFAPCHQREQEIGTPYPELMRLIFGISLEQIDGQFYCCGMAGIMGFKKDFYDISVQMGLPLMNKIRELNPDVLVTDCLSCRLQFDQCLPYPVSHPIEILHKFCSPSDPP